MDRSSSSSLLSVHEYYRKYMDEGENMRVRLYALLNEINRKRVLVKELHVEFGVKFSEHINSYRNRLDEISGDYEALTEQVVARREELMGLCHAAANAPRTRYENDSERRNRNSEIMYLKGAKLSREGGFSGSCE